jgi:hypothetical protein
MVMKLRYFIFGIVVSLLVLFVPSVMAQDGLMGALSRETAMTRARIGFEQQLAAADFDNDQVPDGALLLADGFAGGERSFRIELHITSGENHVITFLSAERSLSVRALDVNRDGAPDVVVETAFTHQRLQVYLNDGRGVFHRARPGDFVASDLPDQWQSRITLSSPAAYLPPTRSSEPAGQHKAFAFNSGDSRDRDLWLEAPRVQSTADEMSPSRAPPLAPAL